VRSPLILWQGSDSLWGKKSRQLLGQILTKKSILKWDDTARKTISQLGIYGWYVSVYFTSCWKRETELYGCKAQKKKKVHQNNFQVQFGNETLPYKLRICLNSLFPQGSHKPHNFIKCGNQKQHWVLLFRLFCLLSLSICTLSSKCFKTLPSCKIHYCYTPWRHNKWIRNPLNLSMYLTKK
jgi:hypothetical protein